MFSDDMEALRIKILKPYFFTLNLSRTLQIVLFNLITLFGRSYSFLIELHELVIFVGKRLLFMVFRLVQNVLTNFINIFF
jgi:hypothetical protein